MAASQMAEDFRKMIWIILQMKLFLDRNWLKHTEVSFSQSLLSFYITDYYLKQDMAYGTLLDNCANGKNEQQSNAEIQNSLRQEILHLERRLQDQVSVRYALEKALGYTVSCHDTTDEIAMAKLFSLFVMSLLLQIQANVTKLRPLGSVIFRSGEMLQVLLVGDDKVF
ncbi:Hypothetical predicted protein [Olea europaea subsp. europaea]|uniref:Uncharacterized protein n=1 Tax=Olea europaea subsp. europaea TaxID=158383 RepID=A0A8S0PZS4_OLEEU|nr:Hypothetical predicted protein [Olea europaea subsp. europaea]